MNSTENNVAGMDAAAAVDAVTRRATKSRINAAGLEWTVLELGHGEKTLVLLPGALGTVEIFSKQLLRFSEHARVVVLGYPGSADQALMTESFYALLQKLNIAKAHFVGSSLGAYWLQVFTHERTGMVESLVLGNTFVDAEPLQANPLFARPFLEQNSAGRVKQAWLDFVEGLPASELRSLQLAHVGPHQAAEELHGRISTVANAGHTPLSSVAPDKIALLTCDDDAITHGAMGEALSAAYPGVRHERLPRGGHYPHVNNAAAYNAVIASVCGLPG
jgi:maspardin